MVDSLGPTAGHPLGTRNANASNATDAHAGAATEISGKGVHPVRAADSVSLSDEARHLPPGLKGGPPIDAAAIDRIKGAIADGQYPIDRERIADKLFESFKEMMK